jgi:hypothetical protein
MRGAGRLRAARALSGPLVVLAFAYAPALALAQGVPRDSLRLRWTAPGDDGRLGAAVRYEVRMATVPVLTEVDFALAVPLDGVPTPLPASSPQTMWVRGIERARTYWFAVRAQDEAGNWSGLSNVLRWDGVLDQSPPNAPAGVGATLDAPTKTVRVIWQPNAEGDLAGYYIHRSASASGPWDEVGRVLGRVSEYRDQELPEYDPIHYQVSAFDTRGNVSARSRVAVVSIDPPPFASWTLRPAYPNPARVGEVQRIPLQAPAGAGDAALEVVDAAGSRVRRLSGRMVAPGVLEFDWDGRNDAGALCAPGVYRVRVLAGGVRQAIRVARVP